MLSPQVTFANVRFKAATAPKLSAPPRKKRSLEVGTLIAALKLTLPASIRRPPVKPFVEVGPKLSVPGPVLVNPLEPLNMLFAKLFVPLA